MEGSSNEEIMKRHKKRKMWVLCPLRDVSLTSEVKTQHFPDFALPVLRNVLPHQKRRDAENIMRNLIESKETRNQHEHEGLEGGAGKHGMAE